MPSDSPRDSGNVASPSAPRVSASAARLLLTALLLLSVAFVAARSINYLSTVRPGPDAGVYSAVGVQLLDGKALYRDTMDAKPPVIYLLNAAGLGLGDRTFHSIRIMERVFAVIAAALVFFIVLTIFRRRSLATLAAAGYALTAYSDIVFEEGNVTEEYANVFVLAGILCIALAVTRGPRWARWAPWLAAGSGFFFACAVFTKEPFLFSSVAWFALIAAAPRDGWKPAVRRGLMFVLGALVPACIFFGYLLLRGDFAFWIERLTGSMGYIASLETQGSYLGRLVPGVQRLVSIVFRISRTGTLAFAAGVIAALVPSFARRYRFLPCAAVLAFVMEFIGATLSPALYGHYFLQVMPSFVLCAAAGGALLLDLCERAFHGPWPGRALLLIVPCLLDFSTLNEHRLLLQQPFARAEPGAISRFIREHAEPGDRLWVSKLSGSRYYVETGLASPTNYIHYFPGWFTDTRESTGAEKLNRLKTDLGQSPPAYIVTGDDEESLRASGLLDWMCAGYTLAPIEDVSFKTAAHLYVRNDRAANIMPPGAPARDEACAMVYINQGSEAYQAGAWQKAVEASGRALALDSRSVAAWNNLCVSFIKLGSFDQAIESCNAALAIEPANELARNNLGWAQSEKNKQGKPGK